MKTLAEYGAETFANCERRNIHVPQPPTLEEMQTKAHAEVSEVFEAWLRRGKAPEPTSWLQVAVINPGLHEKEFVAEYLGNETTVYIENGDEKKMRKPEGVAAELADVVLTLAYVLYRKEVDCSAVSESYFRASTLPGACSIVHALAWLHKAIATDNQYGALSVCFAIAARLGIDLDAALERKHAYNNVRPPTDKRL